MTTTNKDAIKTRETILEENKDYTLFSWAAQEGLKHIAVAKVAGL